NTARSVRHRRTLGQAFHMGRHILGYEIQTASAVVDWAERQLPGRVHVTGGEIALLCAAADPRIQSVHLCDYTGPPDPIWEAPLDRNLYGEAIGFGEKEIRSLVRPREILEIEIDVDHLKPRDLDLLQGFDPAGRHQRLFTDLEQHLQRLVRASNDVREQFYLFQAEPLLEGGKWSTNKEHPTLDPANFIENSKAFREKFHNEAMGAFHQQLLEPNPRSRQILETDEWKAWDVVLDVYPDFFAWGVLILPKNLNPDERRPVVVCQHGRNGIPRDCIDANKPAYNDFAAKLAERGFITFVPHNLYRGEDRYRVLDRKANAVGCSLFSFIIPSHRQILDWLKTQPYVDSDRIAFYGLSYGGETAVRVPPVLEDYAVVICSGDFNQWTRKVAATDFPNGFMKTIEWEMPYWNLGHTFDYAEMSYLIFPRPFMVERGHHDRVSRDHWVAHEYAKTRWLYAQFGMANRTEIEYFQGGHSINGKGTFEFLHKHLDWPKR
ncbi:MAG: prolyl oligopeptidase family serine peptidase, partial [Verrucomicrobiota bacterium]